MDTSFAEGKVLTPDDTVEGDDTSPQVDSPSRLTIKSPDEKHREVLEKLDGVARAMVASKGPGFISGLNAFGWKVFKPTSLSKYFLILNQLRRVYNPACLYSEHLMLLFGTAEKLGMWHEKFISPECESWVPGQTQAERFDELLNEMRRVGSTREFKSRVYEDGRNRARNLKSASTYEEAMFKCRSRLVVIRLDFGYCAEHGESITAAEAKRDFKRFLDNRRHCGNLFRHMKGYIWKLEYGNQGKGYHYHLILFFDGGKIPDGAYHGERISQYWKSNITQGQGYCHNCNLDSHKYRFLGVGMIHRDDLQKRDNLRRPIEYLTKEDYCIKRDMAGTRVFGTGGRPPLNLKGVGRPPTKHDPNRNYRGRLLPLGSSSGRTQRLTNQDRLAALAASRSDIEL